MSSNNEARHKTFLFSPCTGDPSLYEFDNITPEYFTDEDNLAFETVCGEDQRIKVADTRTLPYSAICKLYMKAANGRNLVGTGWLSHKNKLYTAGHCVYSSRHGGWMQSITIVPGLAGPNEPYGRYSARDLLSNEAWVEDGSLRYDMGAILLSENVVHTDFLSPTLDDADVGTVCGYPADRDQGVFQYRMHDAVSKRNERFFYQIDTFGGQSGSPLLRGRSRAIGIHNYGGCDNKASDLYREFVDAVNSW